MNEQTLGKTAWDAYSAAVGGVAFNGDKLPEFNEMDDTRKEGWEAAARAVVQRYTDASVTTVAGEAKPAREEYTTAPMSETEAAETASGVPGDGVEEQAA